jgi:primosomal protein N' (replication factor Y)
MRLYAEVLIPLRIDPFWYEVPERLLGKITVGKAVLVPLKTRKQLGIVLRLSHKLPEGLEVYDLKEIFAVEEGPSLLSPKLIELLEFASGYYACPLGTVLKSVIPQKGRRFLFQLSEKGRRLLEVGQAPDLIRKLKGRPLSLKVLERTFGAEQVEKAIREDLIVPFRRSKDEFSLDVIEVGEPEEIRDLNLWQKRALNRISQGGSFLLFGVTGSGKTAVYLQLIRMTLNAGKNVLVLVPEIGLTPQLYTRLKRVLDEPIALLHSGLSPSERWEELKLISMGKARVVLGVRSAVFSPLKDLGLIVVDEEHDSSYKAQDGPFRYNARDMALMRGKLEGATVVLGSATPSIESFYNAQKGKLTLVELPVRVRGSLPEVEIVDLKEERGFLSSHLVEALKECLYSGGQALLFLNRRGYAPVLLCRDCGEVLKCRYCSVSLTYHASKGVLLCHYCGFSIKAPQVCSNCGGKRVFPMGFGTERVVEELKVLFPDKKIARMDSDSIRGRRQYELTLRALQEGEIDMLVGTQMVVKGHHFPRIKLVGVLLADLPLSLPDFRSAERTFQLLTQAAGRAGRGEGRGRVIIQTYLPDHYAIRTASSQDYRAFFKEEINRRKALKYPPFVRLALLRVWAKSEEEAKRATQELRKYLEAFPLEVLGPAPSPIEKLYGRWRWQILLKSPTSSALREALKDLPRPRRVTLEVDVDPVSLL